MNSLRVGCLGGNSNALETYDVVEIYSQNPPARRKPFTPEVNSFVAAVPLIRELLRQNYSMEVDGIEPSSELDCRSVRNDGSCWARTND